MTPNPLLGVIFHWLGGLASGSFYVPYRGVKRWSWETYWLIGGFFSWIIAPVTLGMFLTNDLPAVLREASGSTLFWCYFWGMMWGLGGLTFGLTMRYLGMSLGMAVALGYCAAFGTLMPPIFDGVFVSNVLGTTSGQVILAGVAVCLSGIAFAGKAGMSKEREMSAEQKQEVIKEFNLKKGILVATFSGVMSACFSYGLRAGDPIKAITLSHGTTTLWQGLPVLVPVLLGGFTTNFIWCVALNIQEPLRPRIPERAPDQGSHAPQLSALRPGGHHLVLSVLLLHHGRDADGRLQVFQLDAAHGEHHHLQQPVGHRAPRMARSRRAHQRLAGRQSRRAGAFHHGGGLRQLSRNAAALIS